MEKNFENMFMTSFYRWFLKDYALMPVFIQNGWMEVDIPSDLRTHSF